MARKFPSRPFDGLKSHRRTDRYQTLVKELLARSDGTIRGGAEQEESEPLSEDSRASMEVEEPIDPRGANAEELMTLVTKPPPRAFQAYRL
ncbi:hypothetical protein HPB52_025530 [Rhipicephalus sanguineus]|uniref:Uncharacterized protein n=1 Tax=Rhipicephalus sanguineus TaxID=34632 RepID=A0A9D4SMF9_RHISA|nr:hypothetical protein HPB52_025530 [Rhipicephalus sanguineus]